LQGTLPPRHTLSVKDAAALEPFYRAQRDHGPVYTWRQLRERGAVPKPKEDPTLKQICDGCNREYGTNYDYDTIFGKKDTNPTDNSV